MRAACVIPLKKRAKRGTYRLAMREEFDEELYHRRNLVETVFSVEKRVFGDVNHSRRREPQQERPAAEQGEQAAERVLQRLSAC